MDALAEICHRHGAKLLVDGAHGAHLPLVLPGQPNCLLGVNPYQAVDGVTVSAHKTLPAPGQTGLIFANGVELRALRRAAGLTGTSSPSFVMLAALDRLRPWLHAEGRGSLRRVAAWCGDLRGGYPCLPLSPGGLDPCRLVLQVEDGRGLAQKLEGLGIYVEMADRCHVVCILAAADSERDILRLKRALNFLGVKGRGPRGPRSGGAAGAGDRPLPPPGPLCPRPAAAAGGRGGEGGRPGHRPLSPRGAGGGPGRGHNGKNPRLFVQTVL